MLSGWRALVLLLVPAAALALSASASAGSPPCADPSPGGGGVMEYAGVGTPNHYSTRAGDVCPGETDTWSASVLGVPISQAFGFRVVPADAEVTIIVRSPYGEEFEPQPGEAFRATHYTDVDLKYTVTVTGAGDGLSSYLVQACRSINPSCVFSQTVTPVAGDVSCNGVVDAKDATLVLQYDARLLAELPCASVAQGDLDSRINSLDAALILQLAAGLIDHLPSVV